MWFFKRLDQQKLRKTHTTQTKQTRAIGELWQCGSSRDWTTGKRKIKSFLSVSNPQCAHCTDKTIPCCRSALAMWFFERLDQQKLRTMHTTQTKQIRATGELWQCGSSRDWTTGKPPRISHRGMASPPYAWSCGTSGGWTG